MARLATVLSVIAVLSVSHTDLMGGMAIWGIPDWRVLSVIVVIVSAIVYDMLPTGGRRELLTVCLAIASVLVFDTVIRLLLEIDSKSHAFLRFYFGIGAFSSLLILVFVNWRRGVLTLGADTLSTRQFVWIAFPLLALWITLKVIDTVAPYPYSDIIVMWQPSLSLGLMGFFVWRYLQGRIISVIVK